jgi:segregation and condensation protein B
MASEVARAIEAIVMVTEEPIAPHLLAQILEVTPARVEELCAQLAESYVAEDRGFELVRVAGGYRFQSHPDLSGYVERFALEGQSSRLSAAALETLALVAYKQPVSRAQVAEVRGVSVDGVMRTLQHRGYVTEVARDTGPGQAVLYGTTTRFLERLGIDSVDQLPPLAQFVPGPEVMDALDAGLRHGGARSSPGPVEEPPDLDEPETVEDDFDPASASASASVEHVPADESPSVGDELEPLLDPPPAEEFDAGSDAPAGDGFEPLRDPPPGAEFEPLHDLPPGGEFEPLDDPPPADGFDAGGGDPPIDVEPSGLEP